MKRLVTLQTRQVKNSNFGNVYMKAYKFALFFVLALSTFSNTLAFDCVNEQEFSVSNEHWIHTLSPEVQYFTVLYLSNRTVEQCLGEESSEQAEKLKLKLEETFGTTRLSELEDDFFFLFDTRGAFKVLRLDIMDDEFLEKLRNHELSKG
ncbi:hypothetical protein ACPV4A_11975 [Vibrio rotiferianus]